MGGASLPPYPEDYNTTSKSSSPTLLSQTVKRRRPKKSFGLGRRNKQTGPVDPSEVVPYPENEDDMLDAIVVEGGVLVNGLGSTEQSGTQSRQKRRRVGSQTVPSRGKLMKVGGKPVIAASAGHSPSPVEGSKVNTKKTPPARLLKQPHEEENAPSVECSHRELMATAEAMLSLNGQNNHASVDDRGREISDGALQHTQDMQGEGADSDSTSRILM